MDFKWLALLSFVVHLWPKLNVIYHIQQHYGTEKLQLYRRLERTLLKLRKVQQDIAFLVNCQKYSLIPTFCRIKPSNHASLSARDKLSLQKRLLCLELKNKRRTCNQLSNVYQQLKDDFKQSVGFFTYLWSLQCLWSKAKSDSLIVTDRHAKKIRNLKSRQYQAVSSLKTNKVVINISSKQLTDEETVLLSRGLSFSIPPQKLDKVDIMTSFEILHRDLLAVSNTDRGRLQHKLRDLCYRLIYGYNPNQFNILSGGEKCALRGLLNNNDIVICRPDKGNGVVVMDKVEYSRKLDQILSDKTKFVELACDPTADLESKLNNFLYNLKRTGKIDESTFHHIRSVGACPGRIYGLPKTHKMGVPLRPIVSCVGTYSYNLAQYLVELLQPFSHNSFTVKDSFAFAKEVTTCSSFPFMASFDVTSLFTCVPLEEVINICLDKLFANTNTVNNLNRTQLYKMLSFTLKQNHFLFDGKVYNQVDGVAMGSPLGPVMANIFMCELERKALEQYNGTLPPCIGGMLMIPSWYSTHAVICCLSLSG